jgi:hypothetical protein
MRPQYYSWLFDDKAAWEKSLADPRYSYELPIDAFMSIYCSERGADPNAMPFSMPMPAMPMVADAAKSAAVFNTHSLDVSSVIAPENSKEEKKEEGILSQDDIDALLSGL